MWSTGTYQVQNFCMWLKKMGIYLLIVQRTSWWHGLWWLESLSCMLQGYEKHSVLGDQNTSPRLQSCCGLSSQPERCMLKHGRSYSSPSALLLFHLAEGSCSRKRCCVTRWVPGEQGEHKGTEFWQCEMGLRSFSLCSCCPGGPGWVFQPLKLPLVWPVAWVPLEHE